MKGIQNQEEKNRMITEKLKNIDLLESNIQIKIADLGFARELSYEDLT